MFQIQESDTEIVINPVDPGKCVSESTQENLAHFMDKSTTDFGQLCLSLFAGYFSFGGW